MAGPLVVPDASVILKWVLPAPGEEGRDPSLALKTAWLNGTIELVVPTLWAFEAGNVLGLKQPAQAESLLTALFDLLMPETPPTEYAPAILRLMRRHGVTFYDAAYHALAIARAGTMLTADQRYVRKTGAAGHVALIDTWTAG